MSSINNTKTVILIFVLITIALFLAGFRLGRQVERIDKNYVPPVSPTLMVPTVAMATPAESMTKFKTLTHTGCGISFLYPDTLAQTKNSSDSGMIGKGKNLVSFTCPTKIASQTANLLTPTITTVNGTKITSYASMNDSDTWFITKNAKRITFNTSQNLTDLIMRTVSFIK